ncbi:Polygalacturonase [Vitis vinifera]|uniref:Polygalacturonase n=1 Tax=Vitis vinifera TaxID=29760 RepID=A0A438FXC6_VITVI|nr:Polygalacturonase [Vitis vinifera]
MNKSLPQERDKAKIDLKLNITATSLLLLLASDAEVSGDTIFYVTKYGDKVDGNTDITQALLKAWGDACALPVTSTVMIPDGTYALGKFKAEGGWIAFQQIDQFILSGGGVFDGQGKTNLRNLTFYNVAISAPEDSLNTDGIHIGRSSGIHISDSTIEPGDDCVSIGDGSEQINIQRVTYGLGHGICVGSLGKYPNEEPLVGISVKNCIFTNTQNGSPSRIKLSNVSFRNIRGTTSTQVAVKLVCSQGVPCQDVKLGDINLKYSGNEGPAMSQCKNIKPNLLGKPTSKDLCLRCLIFFQSLNKLYCFYYTATSSCLRVCYFIGE